MWLNVVLFLLLLNLVLVLVLILVLLHSLLLMAGMATIWLKGNVAAAHIQPLSQAARLTGIGYPTSYAVGSTQFQFSVKSP